jgi:hypothetical protein
MIYKQMGIHRIWILGIGFTLFWVSINFKDSFLSWKGYGFVIFFQIKTILNELKLIMLDRSGPGLSIDILIAKFGSMNLREFEFESCSN